jgi:hypothetical protein
MKKECASHSLERIGTGVWCVCVMVIVGLLQGVVDGIIIFIPK